MHHLPSFQSISSASYSTRSYFDSLSQNLALYSSSHKLIPFTDTDTAVKPLSFLTMLFKLLGSLLIAIELFAHSHGRIPLTDFPIGSCASELNCPFDLSQPLLMLLVVPIVVSPKRIIIWGCLDMLWFAF